MKWRKLTESQKKVAQTLSENFNISEVLINIAINRGLSDEEIKIVLRDYHEGIIDPHQLTNAYASAQKIAEYANDPDAEIWIYADYDTDGITSGYILKSAVKECAVSFVEVYYPERSEHYGLSMDFCQTLVKSNEKEQKRILVITVDNGITKVNEVAYLQSKGIEVIITDHHKPKAEVPNCLIVDAHNHGEPDTFKHLAGCGVTFKVAELYQEIMLNQYNKQIPEHNMEKYIFAVAIGTIADMVPLTVENITLVKYGLLQINNEATCPEGIKAFKKYVGKSFVSSSVIAWDLGPRINSCGRMGNVNLASKLFFVEELTQGESLEKIINQIELVNETRKEKTKEAEAMLSKLDIGDNKVCVIDASEYPEGIAGIIAGRATERFNRPAIILHGKDRMTGSARSVNGIGLQELLQTQVHNGNVLEFGGHDEAAGLKVRRNQIDNLQASLNESLKDYEFEAIQEVEDNSELVIDDILCLEDINQNVFELINDLPYDKRRFKEPVFCITFLDVITAEPVKSNPVNLWLTVSDGDVQMKLKANNLAQAYKDMGSPETIHIAGNVKYNFMYGKGKGQTKYTFEIIDLMKPEE